MRVYNVIVESDGMNGSSKSTCKNQPMKFNFYLDRNEAENSIAHDVEYARFEFLEELDSESLSDKATAELDRILNIN